MKITIDIPDKFINDYTTDRFKDFFSRVAADIDNDGLCGNYEKETAEMFLKAFGESGRETNADKKPEMERLTERSANSNMVWFKDYENDNARLEPCKMTAHHNRIVIEKLSTYEDLEEQGRLVKLPLKACDCQHNSNSKENEPCCRCNSRQTNADRIRNMSDEELAEFITGLSKHCLAGIGECDCSEYETCQNCNVEVKKWLQSEVE